jgi:PAS domain S-box-containing protein
MSSHRKGLLLIIGATLFGVLAVLYVSSRLILLSSYTRLEEREVKADVQHILGELSEAEARLNTMAVDYADWDDTYAFVAGELSDYPQTNLTDQTYQLLQLNLVLIVNTAGEIVYGSGYDLEAGKPTPMPAGLLAHINVSDRLLDHPTLDSSLTGIVLLPEGPLIVASRPILTSDYRGPIRGTLIIGRYLLASEIDQHSQTTNLSLAFHRFDDPQLPADFAAARASFSPASPTFIQPLDADTVAGYSPVMDLYGQPALLLRVGTARTIYTQGQASLNYFIGWLVILGLVSSAVFYVALDRLILSQQAHEAAEAKYRSIFENAVEGIFQSTPAGRFINANPAMARTYGYDSPQELIESVSSIASQIYVHPDERDKFDQMLQAGGVVDNFEGQNYRQDGSIIWTSTSARVVQDAAGNTLYYEGFIQDITGRKQAEDALRGSEEHYRLLFESNPLPMWAYDLETLRFVNVNDAAIEHYGYSKDEFLAMTLKDIRPPEELPRLEANLAEPRRRQERSGPWMHRKKDGTLIDVEIISHDLMFLNRPARLVLAHDITERKRAEQKLEASEKRFRALIENIYEGIVVVDAGGKIQYISPSSSRVLGHPSEEMLGQDAFQLIHPEDLEHVAGLFAQALQQPEMRATASIRFRYADGAWRWVEAVGANAFAEPSVRGMIVTVRDITERMQAEATLARLARYNELLLNSAGAGIYGMDLEGKITLVNPAAAAMLGWEAKELRGQFAHALLHHTRSDGTSYPQEDCPIYAAFRDGAVHHVENEVFWRKDGTSFPVEYTSTPMRDENGALAGAVAVFNDITARKRAEAELRIKNLAIESSLSAIGLADLEGNLIYVNEAFCKLWKYDRKEEVIGRPITDLAFPKRVPIGIIKMLPGGAGYIGEDVARCRDGSTVEVQMSATVVADETGRPIGLMASFLDITARKQAEAETKRRLAELEAVNQISVALRAAHTQADMLPVALDVILEVMRAAKGAIWLYDPAKDEVRTAVTRGWGEETGGPPPAPEKPGEGIAGYVFASGQPYVTKEYHLDLRLAEAVRRKIPAGIGGAAIPIRAAGAVIGVFDVNVPLPREMTPDEVHLLTILGEIAGNAIQRARLHEQTEQRLQRLDALRDIDAAINASLNLQLTLNVFIDQVIARLGVDAAAVSLLNSRTHMLEYMAGRGFRTQALEQTRQRLGEGITGRAALERRTIHIPNLHKAGKGLQRTALLIGEGFVTYYGVPLIAKGQVMGVLEVFQRTLLEPDAEWLDFLNVLAEQAAIAIDNATLFDNLQRSNAELTLAYDATIEGWSRALDLRDKETEGHTRRVTETTIQLAGAFGLSDEELVQVRRGALLHDIGKMGIPDRILLKPGPLSDDEWVLMKMHPAFAYEMLSPIRYLRPALDIPYCHHEKWDGTGYPRGLKGEQIPRAARIFAMVDVWDALRSDRPYRPAWPEERVREHLRSLSGTHFDPQVVGVFLNLLAGRA